GIQPIGAPLPDTQALVLNAGGGLCGIGEPGEIALRTPFATLGYLNLPDENRRRFRRNPFRDDDSDLVYFTGDRGRYRPDGLLEICGRLDDQVKIRGVRVEPGEVAAVLAHHESVRDCAVVATTNPLGEPALVAYYAADGDDLPDPASLRAFLRQRLTGPMVPSAWCRVDALPLLPNGKIDRNALPPPDWEPPAREYVAPRSPVEQALADIWREILEVPRVGVRDDFFDLGGHSLAATRAIARANAALDTRVPLRALFDAPTVEELARAFAPPASGDAQERRRRLLELRLARSRGAAPGIADARLSAPASDAAASDADGVAPLSWAQQALWFVDRLAGPSGTYNIAMSARLAGALRIDALERSLQALVERHDSLRTAFDDDGGQPVQRVIRDAKLALSVERLDALAAGQREEALRQRLLQQASIPFDLACAPLVRARLYCMGPDEHVLLLVVHHIVADGWSRAVIAHDLGALYSAQLNGTDPALPALPCQFRDVARRQRETPGAAASPSSLEYWRQQLAGIGTLELPQDRSRPARPSHRGGVVGFRLERGQVDRLKSLSHDAGATLYMTLLAAFDVLLMR